MTILKRLVSASQTSNQLRPTRRLKMWLFVPIAAPNFQRISSFNTRRSVRNRSRQAAPVRVWNYPLKRHQSGSIHLSARANTTKRTLQVSIHLCKSLSHRVFLVKLALLASTRFRLPHPLFQQPAQLASMSIPISRESRTQTALALKRMRTEKVIHPIPYRLLTVCLRATPTRRPSGTNLLRSISIIRAINPVIAVSYLQMKTEHLN